MSAPTLRELYNQNTILIGSVQILQNELNGLKEYLLNSINKKEKEFIDDLELEELFGITKSIRYRLLKSKDNPLKAYKLNGKLSKSLYKYSEVIELINSNAQFKKS